MSVTSPTPITWGSYSARCSNRVEPRLERRPGNALNIEIGSPAPRCLHQPPDGRGVTRDGGTLDWLRSGGSVLAYGRCEAENCPRLPSESPDG